MWPWPRRSEQVRASNDVGSQAEAFVLGTYAKYLESSGRRIPSWAWINCLAHASESKLTALANGTYSWGRDGWGSTQWYRAVSFLATELLTRAKASDQTVRRLQQVVLVPLEADLVREEERRRLGPADLVTLTLAALSGHSTNRR